MANSDPKGEGTGGHPLALIPFQNRVFRTKMESTANTFLCCFEGVTFAPSKQHRKVSQWTDKLWRSPLPPLHQNYLPKATGKPNPDWILI